MLMITVTVHVLISSHYCNLKTGEEGAEGGLGPPPGATSDYDATAQIVLQNV